MNPKSLLLAGLVLATPACAVSADDVDAAKEDAAELRSNVQLGAKSFLSKSTFKATRYRMISNNESEAYEVTVRYRLRFVPAGAKGADYEYDGDGVMEYEAELETVDVDDPSNVIPSDFTYYAKRTGSRTFRLFDCDSTRVCSEQRDSSKAVVFRTGGVEQLVLSGLATETTNDHGIHLEGNDAASIPFEAEAK